MFRFEFPKDFKSIVPDKFARTTTGNEVFGNSNVGPVFGFKHDFFGC